LPLVPLYAAGAAWLEAVRPARRLKWPVISVGNLSVGGTGKTPFTVALARMLTRRGLHVDVLTRGYGRRETKVTRVDPEGDAAHYGDEPLLIANEADVPVYVADQRWEAGQLAERDWAVTGHASGVHLLDDGFQHRQLERQVDIVLVNSRDLKDWLLPAGNLREGAKALRRAQVLAVETGDDAAMERLQKLGLGAQADQPVWRYRREMYAPHIPESLMAHPVIAFCGIGRPEQFFAGLSEKGLKVAESVRFPDHHTYTAGDVERLRRLAVTRGAASLVTTAKDMFRLGVLSEVLDMAEPVFAVDVAVTLEEEEEKMAWLEGKLEPVAA
jgi:tetraacyldisaccharide 4'-kinase